LKLKNRSEWDRKPFLVTLPEEDHIYRISPCVDSTNIGFVIARLPFQHPSQAESIIKVLRRQAVYSTLLLSCTGKLNASPNKEKFEYFEVKAVDDKTISVTFQHPLHTSLLSVNFVLHPNRSVKTELISASDAPDFCTQAYIDKVINRCLSIPITMRCILRKAASYIPVNSDRTGPVQAIKTETPRPKQLKLRIPPFNMDNSASIPLVSPGVYKKTLPTFSIGSDSGSGSSFEFPVGDSVSTLPGAYTKPAASNSMKKLKDSPGKPSTPGTPKSRAFKLPKITLKRKRDGTEYEIDKEKSSFDVLEETDAHSIADSLSEDASEAANQQSAQPKPATTQGMVKSLPIQDNQPRDITFTTNSMPFDLSVDALSSNAISINSVGELEGLLGTSIDVSSIMGGGLVTQLGIPGSTFPDGFGSITPSTEGVGGDNQMEAFDLNAISSGSNLAFGVDDSLSGVSTAAIDPSMVVSSTASLSNAPSYDVQQSLFDIDSFMMSTEDGSMSSTDQ